MIPLHKFQITRMSVKVQPWTVRGEAMVESCRNMLR